MSLRRAVGDVLWAGGGCPQLLLTAGHSMEAAGLTGPALAWWRELAADSERIRGPARRTPWRPAGSWPPLCWPPGTPPRR